MLPIGAKADALHKPTSSLANTGRCPIYANTSLNCGLLLIWNMT